MQKIKLSNEILMIQLKEKSFQERKLTVESNPSAYPTFSNVTNLLD